MKNSVWTAKNFKWASERYPSRTALPDLLKVINASLSEIDQALKKRSTAYNGVRSKLSQMEKKSTASLVTRPLNDLVKVRKCFVTSEDKTIFETDKMKYNLFLSLVS